MTKRLILGFFLLGTLASGQTTSARIPSNWKPSCPPGGKASAELEPIAIAISLDRLVYMSDLIIDGTVTSVLPGINRNPSDPTAIMTHSLVSAGSILWGTLPAGINTVVIAQEGGKTADCEEVVPANPLLAQGERYIFFLQVDSRQQPPNTTGFPRYEVIGVWGGKAKVVNDLIQFLPAAHPGLHKLDTMYVITFLDLVKDRVGILRRFEGNPIIPITPKPPPPPPYPLVIPPAPTTIPPPPPPHH